MKYYVYIKANNLPYISTEKQEGMHLIKTTDNLQEAERCMRKFLNALYPQK